MRQLHIVWDWNGTLLDDLEVIVDSLNVGIADFGVPSIDADQYRDHFTRPVRSFYDSLLGRPVDDMEWAELNKIFHDEYFKRVRGADLTGDSLMAMDRVAGLGWSQSLLSMSPHPNLIEIVRHHRISHRFKLIQGLETVTGGLKAGHLEAHLDRLGLEPGSTVMVGDTPDDAEAAEKVGAHAILYDGGSHHLTTLQELRRPVAGSLMEAIEIAVQIAASPAASPPS